MKASRFMGCLAIYLALVSAVDLGAAEKTPVPVVRQKISLSFRDTPVIDIFDVLSKKDRVNIVLGKTITGNISLNLYDISVHDAIFRVAEAAGYVVEFRKGEYFIVERKDVGLDHSDGYVRVKSFKVNYSDPRQVADILAKHLSKAGKVTPLIQRRMIVIEDVPSYLTRAEKLLEEIDVRPKQILIEAKVMDIILDDGEVFGVDWSRIFGGSKGKVGTEGLSQGDAIGGAKRPGFFLSFVDNGLSMFLEAQTTRNRVRTLSSPTLLALENQEAKTVIGNSTGYKVTTTINQVTSESIQFLESGVILKVTPSVDQQGRILLKVHPEVSSATVNAGIPSKKSTEVTTEFLCEDGQSVFIGGLLKKISTQEQSGIPVLGDMPVVGTLFSTRTEGANNTETVVIITPRIVRDARELAGQKSDAAGGEGADAGSPAAEPKVWRIEQGEQEIEQARQQLQPYRPNWFEPLPWTSR